MKKYLVLMLLTIQFVPGQTIGDEDRAAYDTYFEQAGKEFGVPPDILRGISFTQTRWSHMRWAKDDTISSCSGMPRVYGLMGLWDNEYFGHSLRDAGALIGKSADDLKENPQDNVRGAAALLKKYFDDGFHPLNADPAALESWYDAIAKLSGIPQQDLAQQISFKTYQFLSEGYHLYKINLPKRSIQLNALRERVLSIRSVVRKQEQSLQKTTGTPDYPPAIWRPGKDGYFYTSGYAHAFVVIHDMESTYEAVVSYFQTLTDGRQVSIHYCVNGKPDPSSTAYSNAPAGEITQMVEEKNWAWHAVCWNRYMFGIEHEGYVSNPAWFTPEMYNASSQLVMYLCNKYNIPKDRNHIIGHDQKRIASWVTWVNSTNQGFDPECNSHTDPGSFWDWTGFMAKVTANDTIAPKIVSVSVDSGSVRVKPYNTVSIQFNTPMDITSAAASFSILPSTPGSLKWNSDNTVMTFIPSSAFQFNTVYTMTIDSSAKSIGLKKSLGGIPYSLTFKTVDVDTVGPVVVRAYPRNNETGVPLKPYIILRMSDSVQTTTLGPSLKLYDPDNKTVSLTYAKNESINDSALISFSPTLKPNTSYTLKLLPGVKDAYGNLSKDSVVITFTTENESFVSNGSFIDQFENGVTGWKSPSQSSFIRYADTAVTKFLSTAQKKYAGTLSGTLLYTFAEESLGVAPIEPVQPISLDGKSSFGFWAFGDTSNNRLQVICMPDSQRIDLGMINWLGWKYLSFDIQALTGSPKSLAALFLTEEHAGARSGQIFIDDIQTDAVVSGVTASSGMVPGSIVLGQNFPNPFNPATTITFTLKNDAVVTLKVYDLLGREISTVVRGRTAKGDHAVVFDASELPSGIYFYTLTGDQFSITRKMVLMK